MKALTPLLAGLALALAGTAVAKSSLHYADYAGQEVREMRFASIYNWQRVDNRTLVVWTRPSVAYLLTLGNECFPLQGSYQIQIGDVDDVRGRVQVNSGSVRVGQLNCKIVAIQPIDLVAMKQARKS